MADKIIRYSEPHHTEIPELIMIRKILLQLTYFRFARRKLGGTWFKVTDGEYFGGFSGPDTYWTQDEPDNRLKILETESY